METVADRVRRRLGESRRTQVDLANCVELTESQLSKSLSGRRDFSAVELAGIAAELCVSMHWLLTGEEDPMSAQRAARHGFDGASATYAVAGGSSDEQLLSDVALLYRQAYGQ